MNSHLRSLMVTIAAAIFLPIPIFAQGNDNFVPWNENGCAPKRTLVENMRQVLSPRGGARSAVAHRGVFTEPLPGSDFNPAENTWLAMAAAQCMGFSAVEVDLKATKTDSNGDYVLVLEHEGNFARHNDMDGNDGIVFVDLHSQVQVWNGSSSVTTRNWDTSLNYPPRISDVTWSEIEAVVSTLKLQDQNGRYDGATAFTDSGTLRLDNFLRKIDQSPESDSLVVVLDIQNNRVLEKAIEHVENENAFDRVIFKVWIEALPLTSAGAFDLPLDENFVFSISPFNTELTATAELNYKIFNRATNQEEFVSNDVFLGALFKATNPVSPNAVNLAGFEILINGSSASGPSYLLDEALKLLMHGLEIEGYALGSSFRWGVVRGFDYIKTSCIISCAEFPKGNYYATWGSNPNNPIQNWPRLYQENPVAVEARFDWSIDKTVITQDIRSPRSFINSQAQMGALAATF